MPLRNVSLTAYSQDVPREDCTAILSKKLVSALKMEFVSKTNIKPNYQPDYRGRMFHSVLKTGFSTGVDINSRDSTDHMGEHMFFTQKQMFKRNLSESSGEP